MAEATETLKALNEIKSRVGTSVGNGQCYGLVALYSQLLGGCDIGEVSTPQTQTVTADKPAEAIRRGA